MDNTASNIKEVIAAAKKSKERIFPILNKIDRFWEHNHHIQFCDLVKILVKEDLNDTEFTLYLEKLIDEGKIK